MHAPDGSTPETVAPLQGEQTFCPSNADVPGAHAAQAVDRWLAENVPGAHRRQTSESDAAE